MAADQSGGESRIGKGARANGKLEFGAPVRIEGEVEGELSGTEIMIAEGAVVNAKITANTLIIAGNVRGEMVAHQRIELLAGARTNGTIRAPKLILHEGAVFDGDCKMPRDRIAA